MSAQYQKELSGYTTSKVLGIRSLLKEKFIIKDLNIIGLEIIWTNF